MATLEELVPADHFLRNINRFIHFDFIRSATEHLYCPDNGQLATDPVMLFKLLFFVYLSCVHSERQLMSNTKTKPTKRWAPQQVVEPYGSFISSHNQVLLLNWL